MAKRALISVSDKADLETLGNTLDGLGFELVSTGGTAKFLAGLDLPVTKVDSVTGQPEILDGRVKTLHPGVHAGLLADKSLPDHMAQLEAQNIAAFDLLVVNLYPFKQTLESGADFDTCIENIDIGGPAMVRAAAKNHGSILVVTDPSDYAMVCEAIKTDSVDKNLRQRLALKAFQHTASYDGAIAGWLQSQTQGAEEFPKDFSLSASKIADLRYGENPHQSASWYALPGAETGLAKAEILQGKGLSYNNINDADAALNLVKEFDQPAVAIIKHANPCGVAIAETVEQAYEKAFACDTVSAFGGIIAINRPLTKALAESITQIFTEVVIAPAVDDDAKAIFATKPNLRLLELPSLADKSAVKAKVKTLTGSLLVQSEDLEVLDQSALKTVTQQSLSDGQLEDLIFAFTVAKHVKSNAIVLAKDGATVGVGAGQMSRVDSAFIATKKAGEKAQGSVLASDAFFPFADGVEMAVEAGATAIIQPGGSMRDSEVIEAADAANIAMVFTGMRHFNH